MNRIEVKEQIRQAIASDWSSFERRHPRLAAVVDQDLLVESVAGELSASDDFRHAMEQAQALQLGAQALAEQIRPFVRQALRLLGW